MNCLDFLIPKLTVNSTEAQKLVSICYTCICFPFFADICSTGLCVVMCIPSCSLLLLIVDPCSVPGKYQVLHFTPYSYIIFILLTILSLIIFNYNGRCLFFMYLFFILSCFRLLVVAVINDF